MGQGEFPMVFTLPRFLSETQPTYATSDCF